MKQFEPGEIELVETEFACTERRKLAKFSDPIRAQPDGDLVANRFGFTDRKINLLLDYKNDHD